MVWLLLLNISLISINQENALTELYIVNVADQTILTVSYSTPEISDTEARVNELQRHYKYAYLQEQSASVQVVGLDLLQVLHKLCFFLHEACLLFASMLLELVSHVFKMSVPKDIVLCKESSYFVSCLFICSLLISSLLLRIPLSLRLPISLLRSGATTFKL